MTVHAATGALIGEQVQISWLAFIIGFISHFVIDMIPHGDHDFKENYKNKKKIKRIMWTIILDCSFGLGFIILYFISHPFPRLLPVAAGILGSILPDLLVGVHFANKKLFKFIFRLHFLCHDAFDRHIPFVYAIIVQIIFLGIVISHLRQ